MTKSTVGDPKEMDRLQELLEQLEAVAEEVICDQQEIISLDRRRNTNREALRALKNTIKEQEIKVTNSDSKPTAGKITEIDENSKKVRSSKPLVHCSKYSSKTWMCIGDMFIRMPKHTVMESIEKEQKQMDEGINDLRDGLRVKVNKLRKLEGEAPYKGSSISPLNKEEWNGVKQVLGY